MSVMSELAYDIEQLYIEGKSVRTIATELNVGIEIVEGWIHEVGVDDEEFNPHGTMNS
jgi:transposase